MQIKANTPDQYVAMLSKDRKEAVNKIRKVILKNIPKGFSETIIME
jgi:hypothetical protein